MCMPKYVNLVSANLSVSSPNYCNLDEVGALQYDEGLLFFLAAVYQRYTQPAVMDFRFLFFFIGVLFIRVLI